MKYLGKLILQKKFLVLPKENVFVSKWLKLLNKYWSFDSLYVKSIENIEDDGAEWGTFYPDPKSDIENLAYDSFRKFENSCENNIT